MGASAALARPMAPRVETLRLALSVVRQQPGRSALTVVGLAIGVGAFIAMLSFGEGARRSVLAQFEALGTNLLKVQSTSNPDGKPPEPLTDADIRAIELESTSTLATLPVARNTATLASSHAQRSSMAYGTIPRFARLHAWQLAAGGMFDRTDVDHAAKVCVLGMSPVR